MYSRFFPIIILAIGVSLFLPFMTTGIDHSVGSSLSIKTSSSIIISIPTAIKDLDPLFSNSYYDFYAYRPIYQSLYATYNTTNNLYNWQIKPIIASSYSVAPNGTTWTFNIRSDLVWSDGIALNASDILFTYQILMNPEIDINYYSIYAAFFADNTSRSMKIVNANQVVFNLFSHSFPVNQTYTLLEVFSAAIFPKHVFEPIVNDPMAWQTDITNTGTGTNRTVIIGGKIIGINGPIGSGPYEYAGYNTTYQILSLTINPNFNAVVQNLTAPSIQTIRLTVISDASAAWTSLNADDIQLIDYNTGLNSVYPQLNTSTITHPVSFKSNDYQELGYNQFSPIWGMNPVDPMNFYNLTINSLYGTGITNSTTQVGWWMPSINGNESNIPHDVNWINQLHITDANAQKGNVTADMWFYENLNNSERLMIRLAMDYAIPRQNIINSILNGHGYTLATWVTSYFNMYNPSIQARPFNLTMSGQLLSKVFGYTYHASATDYTSVPYFTMNFFLPISNPSRNLWASQIESAFSAIGINAISKQAGICIINCMSPLINPKTLGEDYVHGGWDAVFVSSALTSPVPNFCSFVQPQNYQGGGNYYLINNSQITAMSNWMINQTGPNAVANATAFQQWCYNNIPSSIIEEDEATFGVSDQLHNFKPTMYQQFNYNEWTFTAVPSSSSKATSFGFINMLLVLALLFIIIIILMGSIFMFLRSRRILASKSPNTNNSTKNNNTHLVETKISPNTTGMDAAEPIILLEDILKESYQVPDYETVLKIQQGGFPDYATFKQALDKGILTYAEWIEYQKKQ